MDWVGFLPYDSLLGRMDPPEGWMATANQRLVADQDPHPISFSWTAPYRYQRIGSLLESMKAPSAEDFRDMQMDVHSLQAERLLPRILSFPYEDKSAQAAVWILKKWDREVRADSQGAALYEVFLTQWGRTYPSTFTPPPSPMPFRM